MPSIETVLKNTAIFAIGALIGGFSMRYTAQYLKSRLWSALAGLVVIALGIYSDHDGLEYFITGIGAPYVAVLLAPTQAVNVNA